MTFGKDSKLENMDQFIKEFRSLLARTLIWSKEFRAGRRNYNFDVDNEVYIISKKYGVHFDDGDLNLIYNLLDFYCDAIKHDFKEIDKSYSVSQSHKDIETILAKMSESSTIELTHEIKDRLNRI